MSAARQGAMPGRSRAAEKVASGGAGLSMPRMSATDPVHDAGQLWTLRLGSPMPPSTRLPLRAGPLSLVFEDCDLRYIRLGRLELVRRIYVMVRDRHWNSFPARIQELGTAVGADRFEISYLAEHAGAVEGCDDMVRYTSRVRMTGGSDGAIRVEFAGSSQTRFLSNRIGICVLHPAPEAAGAPVRIIHVDGTSDQRCFPPLIAPAQPFTDIAALRWEPRPGLSAHLAFEGAVFETEDQRTFGDASFKTFSTPLRLPRPVEVAVGEERRQAVALTVDGRLPAAASELPRRCHLQIEAGDEATGPELPRIGIGVGSRILGSEELALVRLLAPRHVQIVLDPHGGGCGADAMRGAALARLLGVGLEVAVVVGEDTGAADLVRLRSVFAAEQLPPVLWQVLARKKTPSDAQIDAARAALASLQPGSRLAAGSILDFCELNEYRPARQDLDQLCFSMNPQGHCSDDSTVMENLFAIGDAVASARAFAFATPVAITPLRFMPRPGEAATNPRRPRDHRHSALFGAAWSCAALAQAAAAGAQALTIAESVGEEGVLAAQAPGARRVHPLFHVLADYGELAGGMVAPSRVDQPLRIAALAVRTAGRLTTLIANLRPEPTAVRVQGPVGRLALRELDEASLPAALAEPAAWRSQRGSRELAAGTHHDLELAPYAVVRLEQDLGGGG
jgi:hypothetical protein